MDKPFSPIHSSAISQLGNCIDECQDTEEIRALRKEEMDYSSVVKLGKLLSFSLRYRETIEEYKKALEIEPQRLEIHRLLAGRYLSTLQSDKAIEEFSWCLENGGEEVDCHYRKGLAFYYKGDYKKAKEEFESVIDKADPEMEVALIYWHTLSSLRLGEEGKLLSRPISLDKVGHHRSYFESVSFLRGEISESEFRKMAEKESCDMEYSMKIYALFVTNKDPADLKSILKRDEYWFCFSSLASWCDNLSI